MSGQPSATTGRWTSLTLTNPGLIRWTFLPDSDNPNKYRLSRIANRVGRSLQINRDASHRLTSITDDSATPLNLLTFAYGAGTITITDPTALREVQLTIGTAGSTPVLSAVSQVSAPGGPYAGLWQYNYTVMGSNLLLSQVGIIDPNGLGGIISHMVGYNPNNSVSQLTDANGNTRAYTFNGGSTDVAVRDSTNTLSQQWTQKIGSLNETAGSTDAANNGSSVAFADPDNPYRPTSATNRNSQTVTYGYDAYGNVMTESETINGNPLLTTYGYRYDLDPQGVLTSVQEGSRTATTMTYYDGTTSVVDPLGSGITYVQARGLLQSISTPQPGTVGGGTVTTTYAYTPLGNVWYQSDPAPNSATGVVLTKYHYTDDPDYGLAGIAERVGMPLVMEVYDATKVRKSHMHYRYDAAGRKTALIDALGNRTDYYFNSANQPIKVY